MKPCQKIEGKPENESEPKLEEEPKSEEKPEEEEEPEEEEKTEGTFRERLIQSLQEFKEDIHNRHLSKDDMFREVNELDEIRRAPTAADILEFSNSEAQHISSEPPVG
ncbi:WW domain-binding protein 5 [Myotis davidii]|uniref:WW domain-binding protein 5 n=1 Tax=Myotis davidii TaxID=225400 RepID=L5LDE1_MYODS|nr:WW domain-binding protein 5 [Myotis davidii]